MSKYFEKWKEVNERDIAHHECAGYKVSLRMKGREEVENLEVFDMEAYWGRA